MLLLVVAVLGVTGLVAASLELQMSGNLQYQERAFQAAEFAIEQAINSADLSTAYTFADPNMFPAPGWIALVPGSPTDTYAYRLYYDTSAGSIPVPDDPEEFVAGRLPLRDRRHRPLLSRRPGYKRAGILRDWPGGLRPSRCQL